MKFEENYNTNNIAALIEKLAEDKAEVHISTTSRDGSAKFGYGKVYGHTQIVDNEGSYEVALMNFNDRGGLDGAFGMKLIPFINNIGVPHEYEELYESCFVGNEEETKKTTEEKVSALVEKLIEEIKENDGYYDYIDLEELKRDYVNELFSYEKDFHLSFGDFVLEAYTLNYLWDEKGLRSYAKNAGFNDEETDMFVNAVNKSDLSEVLDDGFASGIFDEVKGIVI